MERGTWKEVVWRGWAEGGREQRDKGGMGERGSIVREGGVHEWRGEGVGMLRGVEGRRREG